MAELLARFQQEGPKEAPPPHELAAAVNLIRDANLFSEPTYGYTFWLGKVKRAGVSYSDMVGILKNIQSMNGKYNKGGTLNNQLTKLANARKQQGTKGGDTAGVQHTARPGSGPQ